MVFDFEVPKVLTQNLDKRNIGDYEVKLNHRRLLDGMLEVCGVMRRKSKGRALRPYRFDICTFAHSLESSQVLTRLNSCAFLDEDSSTCHGRPLHSCNNGLVDLQPVLVVADSSGRPL
ncbi:hypothetical protein GOP47_0025826 [Adiantum capillus-veneris]|uniref:Uncharacterized protein n=1 Tax=Adiantum capillus-veneris TaxID=13818 RepID=A0A9D4U1C5_ADICA|nr:hypothetical protein GOP47_0025826 [Adiantum capillus-veneris]